MRPAHSSSRRLNMATDDLAHRLREAETERDQLRERLAGIEESFRAVKRAGPDRCGTSRYG